LPKRSAARPQMRQPRRPVAETAAGQIPPRRPSGRPTAFDDVDFSSANRRMKDTSIFTAGDELFGRYAKATVEIRAAAGLKSRKPMFGMPIVSNDFATIAIPYPAAT